MNYVKTKLKMEMMDHGEQLEVWLDAGDPIKNVPMSLRNDGHKVLSRRSIGYRSEPFQNSCGESGSLTQLKDMGSPTNPDQLKKHSKPLAIALRENPLKTFSTMRFKQYSPKIILACSFGAEDVVLADMMFGINPNAALFYLDTDFLFPETYEVRDRIIAKYGLKPDQVLHEIDSDSGRADETAWRSPMVTGSRSMLRSSEGRAIGAGSEKLFGLDYRDSTRPITEPSECRARGMGSEISIGKSESLGCLVLGTGVGLYSCQ